MTKQPCPFSVIIQFKELSALRDMSSIRISHGIISCNIGFSISISIRELTKLQAIDVQLLLHVFHVVRALKYRSRMLGDTSVVPIEFPW